MRAKVIETMTGGCVDGGDRETKGPSAEEWLTRKISRSAVYRIRMDEIGFSWPLGWRCTYQR